MQHVKFWALGERDQPVVDMFATGLKTDTARVLAYLVLRREHPEIDDGRATKVAIRVGTELGRTAVTNALSRLEDRGYVSQGVVEQSGDGRPPKVWRATNERNRVLEQVYDDHANALLQQAAVVSDLDLDHGENNCTVPPDRVTLGINWLPNGLHAPLYAGANKDVYARRDLEVTFDHYHGSHQVLDAVVSGDADVGLVGAGTVARAGEHDLPVVPVAVLYQRAMTVLYAVRDQFGEALETIDQISGCRVGTAIGSETCLLARLFLSYRNLLDDIQLIDVEGEEHEALVAGTVDIATGMFADPDVVEEQGMTVDSLSVTDQFPMYGLTFILRTDAVVDSPGLVRRFLAGTTEGWAEVQHKPRTGIDAIAGRIDKPAEEIGETFERALDEFGMSDQVERHGWGWHRPETWDRLHTALTRGDVLSDAV